MSDDYSQLVPLLLAGFDWSRDGTFLLRCILLAWMTFMGAFVGSFMNVVVYRLPAGLNLAFPGSRCPVCFHPIRAYDNIPVLSWLLLGGKCRDCSTPISARYPTVEAWMATLFAAVSAVAIWTHPAIFDATNSADEQQLVIGAVLPLVCWMLLVCTLMCAALMEYDEQWIPIRLFVPAILVGVVASLLLPLVPLAGQVTGIPSRFAGVVGLLVGAGWGGLLLIAGFFQLEYSAQDATQRGQWLTRAAQVLAPRVAATAVCGVLLGWQCVTILIVFVTTCHFVHRFIHVMNTTNRQPARWLTYLAAGSVSLLLVWQAFFANTSWLGEQAGFALLAFAVPFIVLLSVVSPLIPIREPLPENAEQEQGATTVTQDADNLQAILNSPSYMLAEADAEFIQRPELRAVRMQLELLKPEMLLAEQGVHSTIVVFGGTQIVEHAEAEQRLEAAQAALASDPQNERLQRDVSRRQSILDKCGFYEAAREFSRIVSSQCQVAGRCDHVVVTGGGPGIMEAANRGAADVGAKSIGLNITLPAEQAPNPYITPELCFQFHYFALRKFHFLLRAQALVVFPGGFGTLDELFNTLTLRQTNRMQRIPIILYGTSYWNQIVNFGQLADEGVIQDEHLELMQFADTPADAWEIICNFETEATPE